MTETAVSPGALTPGLYLRVNLIAGTASAGNGTLRVLILAPKSSAGDLTPDTEIRSGSGEDTAALAFGPGTVGHLAARQVYGAFPGADIEFGAPAATVGTATANITFTGVPTGNTAVSINIGGVIFEEPWLSGETADAIKTRVISGINSRTDRIMGVASSGGVGILAITSKIPGNIGNDIRVKFALTRAQTGTEAVSPTVVTNLAGATTDPDFSDILDSAKGTEYHFILPCLSMADIDAGAAGNVKRVIDHVGLYDEGLEAKLQQFVIGYVGTVANVQTRATGYNSQIGQMVYVRNGMELGAQYAAAEVGGRLAAISSDPAANRIGDLVGTGLIGSLTINSDRLTLPETESLLGNGVSPVSYTKQGALYAVRPVTMYSKTAAGGDDRRLLDTQNVDATYIVSRDLREALPQEFPNAKIVKDQPPGAEDLPEGVIEERDIRAFVASRLRAWVTRGVLVGAKLEAAIEGGELIVQVNDIDASQVDIVVPADVVPGLAKFSTVVNRRPA